MKSFHAAAILTTALVFAFLGSAWMARAKDKPIEILFAPYVAIAPTDLAFMVRIKPTPEDRQLTALLCDLTDEERCTILHNLRLSQIEFQSTLPPKVWTPRPFLNVGPGSYAIAVGIGRDDRFRATDVHPVTIMEP